MTQAAAEEKPDAPAEQLLKMSGLVEASGVPAPTIKHYLREGLLPEPVRTSRNMAWYRPETVERIRLIKRLQEERYLPLKAIRALFEEDPAQAEAMLEVEDRILERALAGERTRTSATEVRKYGVPKKVLERLAEIGILTPNSRGYSPSDVEIIEAMSRFRAGGYDEQIGFTVYDTLRYKHALEALVKEEVDVLMERLEGEITPEHAVELIEAGAEPLKDLIAALHETDGRRGRTPPLSGFARNRRYPSLDGNRGSFKGRCAAVAWGGRSAAARSAAFRSACGCGADRPRFRSGRFERQPGREPGRDRSGAARRLPLDRICLGPDPAAGR